MWQLQETQWGRKRSKRTSETPQGTWLGGTREGSLWLCYAGPLTGRQKVGSRVIGGDRNLFPWRGAVGEVRRGGRLGRRASDKMKERVHRFRIRLRRERRASRLPCLSPGFGDDRRGMSKSKDLSLTIFIPFMICSKSLTFFTNRFFYFSTPPGLRLAFDRGSERKWKIWPHLVSKK